MNADWNKVFSHGGINKDWIYQSKNAQYLAQDYLEKGCHIVQDFNYYKSDISSRAIVVYIIMMMAWMFDVVDLYQKMLKEHLLDNFVYSHESDLIQAKKYQSALRSFVVAHPLRTNRHPDYSFDGDLMCIDISPNIQDSAMFRAFDCKKDVKHISLSGTTDEYREDDCLVTIYSNKMDKSQFHRYLGFSISDVETAINLCVDKLTEIDIYLSKLKKKDYVR